MINEFESSMKLPSFCHKMTGVTCVCG